MKRNKQYRFDSEKNELLKRERGVSFEDVLLSIEEGLLLDDLEHPNRERYPNQRIMGLLIRIKEYVYLVPYVETDSEIFLKTIIPSRKMDRRYNRESRT